MMNPTASSLASYFLMSSFFSAENLRKRCFLGTVVALMFKECSINSLGTPGMSTGFHANTSRLALRKLMSSSSYLSLSPAPMIAVLDSSPSWSCMVFVPTSLAGLTEDWLGLLEGIQSLLRDNSLAAAIISLTELGTRMLEAWTIASLSHSKELSRPRIRREPLCCQASRVVGRRNGARP